MSLGKPLRQLTHHEHSLLKASGLLWELYPQASGNWQEDCPPDAAAREPFSTHREAFKRVGFARSLRPCSPPVPPPALARGL